MFRTITVVLMTNPSRGSAFYFRRKDGEYYDRAFNHRRDILTGLITMKSIAKMFLISPMLIRGYVQNAFDALLKGIDGELEN